MNSNDKIILEQIIGQEHSTRAGTLTKSEFFELFVAEQVLKDYDLGYNEIESGLIGGANDGGIDSIYVLVNGELAQEDFDFSTLKKGVVIETIVIQAKLTDGFGETAVDKFDLPPASRTKVKFVKSVTMENDGHEEEQIYRRTNHWVLAASRSRHADQGVVPQRRF